MTTDRTSDAGSSPLFDLHALVVAVRRRRRFWCALALLGLLAGAALAVLRPPPPAATTKVLVTHQDDQPNDTGTLIRTDVELLGTTRIAGQALKALKSTEKPEDFMADYRGTGVTNNLLQIDVTGANDADAVARVKALADAFVADHVRRMRESAKAEAKALIAQRDRMRKELGQINDSIGTRSPESDPQGSASIESLYARRAELNSRIADFDQRAEEARIGTPKLVAGTQIVDAPRAVHHSLPKSAVTNAGIGFFLGLFLGLAVAAVGSVVADRPVLRREIAANLGASVVAELRGLPGASPGRGGCAGPGRPTSGSPRRWPAPCAARRNPCRCSNWDARAARACSPATSPRPWRRTARWPSSTACRARTSPRPAAGPVTRTWSPASRPPPCRARCAGSASARSRPAPPGPTCSTSAARPCSWCARDTAARAGCTPWRGSSRTRTSRCSAWSWSTPIRATGPTARSGTGCTSRCAATASGWPGRACGAVRAPSVHREQYAFPTVTRRRGSTCVASQARTGGRTERP